MRPSLNSLSSAASDQQTLHDPLGFLQTSCRRRGTTQRRLPAASDATVALGSRPAPNTVQPARPHRAASRAAPAPVGGTARAATLGIFITATPAQPHGICDQAGGRPSLSVEVRVRRAAARRSPYRRAPSQRGGLGGPLASGRTCLRRRRCRGVECRPAGRPRD